MSTLKFFRWLLVIVGGFVPLVSLAQGLPPLPGIDPCPLGQVGDLPCGPGGGIDGAVDYVTTVVFPAGRVLFIALCVLYFFAYAIRMLLESEDTNVATEVKDAYGYGITGMAVISLATFIVEAFGQANNNANELVNVVVVTQAVGNIILFLRLMVATVVTVLIATEGIRIIANQGQDMERLRKRLLYGLLGVAVILLANVIVSGFMTPQGGSVQLATEIVGIANFLLTVIGGLATLAFVFAGALMLTSVDEGNKDRAKKIVQVTVVTLLIVLTSFAFVNYFLAIGLQ